MIGAFVVIGFGLLLIVTGTVERYRRLRSRRKPLKADPARIDALERQLGMSVPGMHEPDPAGDQVRRVDELEAREAASRKKERITLTSADGTSWDVEVGS